MRYCFLLLVIFLIVNPSFAQNEPADLIEAFVTNTMPYLGEPIIYTVTIFDAGVTVGKRYEAPVFDSFGQQSLPIPPASIQTLNGVRYTLTSQDIVLFPNRVGEFIIEPARLLSEGQTLAETDALRITVRPFPPDAPDSFEGAVGQYRINFTVDTESIRLGDYVLMILSLIGEGNIGQLGTPSMSLPSSWRIADLETELITETSLYSERRFTWLIQPDAVGSYTLTPLIFTYFDPLLETYNSLASPEISINISSENKPDPTADTNENNSFQLDFKEISPNRAIGFSWIYWLLWLIPLFFVLPWLILKFLLVMTMRRKFESHINRNAMKNLNQLSYQERYSVIIILLEDYLLAAKNNQFRLQGLSGEDSIKKIEKLLQHTRDLRYAPFSQADFDRLYKDFLELVK